MSGKTDTTRRIRIKVLMNTEGKWAAYGWTDAKGDEPDEVLYDMMSAEDTATVREFWVPADIPMPELKVRPMQNETTAPDRTLTFTLGQLKTLILGYWFSAPPPSLRTATHEIEMHLQEEWHREHGNAE